MTEERPKMGLDFVAATETAIRDMAPLDLLVLYLSVEKGLDVKGIVSATGLKGKEVSERLERVCAKIKEMAR